MKQTLQLKIGQQLSMTPQLQQAIRLLQLSTLDLQQEIQEALDSNPMLELAEEDENANHRDSTNHSLESDSSRTDNNIQDQLNFDDDANIPDDWDSSNAEELPVDAHWDDVVEYSTQSSNNSNPSDFDDKNTSIETLQEKLFWQLNLTTLVDSDRVIATAIIDSIAANGFLSTSALDVYNSIALDLDIEFEEFEAVRQLIQQFEPIGVASQDLRECLLVQLEALPPKTHFINDAKLIVDRYLPLLGNHDYAQLKRRTKFKEGRLKEAINLILSLSPNPGDAVDNENTVYIVPDVYVKKHQNRWLVELNNECSVKLRINDQYASFIKRADNSSDNTFLKDNLQEARWFIKSLENRNETLMKVASKIVEHQRGFLEYGEEAMKPLILSDIAQDIDMHESTISRVTTRKYMHTPRGIFELKYFFSSHVKTDAGGECSSTAIRAIIKKHIAEENTKKPLSDNKIAELLSTEGINVARRTVAKYREAMAIPPSNERKRLV
jgi:RNA polymerase sigma-54 factor